MGSEVPWPEADRVTQAWVPRPSGNQGAQWSEMPRPSKPACSAAACWARISVGVNSSVEAANQ